MYNLSRLWAANNTVEIIQSTITIDNNLYFGAMILVLIFTSLLGYYKYQSFRKVLPVTSFITSVMASYMWAMGWIGFSILIIPIVLFFASIIIVLLTD